MMNYTRLIIRLLSLSIVIALGSLVISTLVTVATAERSVTKPPIYCHYGKGLGKVVYEYDCLSTNEFLTGAGELFDASACTVWEK